MTTAETMHKATEEIKQVALDNGADVVGVASVDALDERAPEGEGIRDIFFDDAETVVVGGVDGMPQGAKATGSSTIQWNSKFAYGYPKRSQLRIALIDAIEKEYGYLALDFPLGSKEGGNVPYASLKSAAEEAGLGRRGINDIVLHPEIGADISFSAVITDMPLEVDSPLEDNPCPTQFCRNAYENAGTTPCIAACPVDALDGDLDEDGEIKNRTFDRMACRSCAQNTGERRFQKQLEKIVEEDDPERRKMLVHGSEFQRTVGSIARGKMQANCFECQMVCPVGHESARKMIADGGVDTENPSAEDVQRVREAILEEQADDEGGSDTGGACGCESCACGRGGDA